MINRDQITGALSGAGIIYAVLSVLILGPEQMWRWVNHSDSKDMKFERAISNPSQQIADLNSQNAKALEQLQNSNSKLRTREEHAINEVEKHRKKIEDLNKQNNKTQILFNNLKKQNNKYQVLLNNKKSEIAAFSKEMVITKDKIIQLEKTNSKLITNQRNKNKGKILASKDVKSTSLTGESIQIFYYDKFADNAIGIKRKLISAGAKVKLTAIRSDYGSSKNTIYYKDSDFLEIAFVIKEVLAPEFDFNKVKNYDWEHLTYGSNKFYLFLI